MENNSTRAQNLINTKEQNKEIARIRGIVRKGNQRGRTLGYPTANLRLHSADIVDGVYVARIRVRQKEYHGVVFVGVAETFDLTDRKLEAHIFDFRRTIYGEWISVMLVHFLRKSKKFSSASALQKAIQHDVMKAEQFFIHKHV